MSHIQYFISFIITIIHFTFITTITKVNLIIIILITLMVITIIKIAKAGVRKQKLHLINFKNLLFISQFLISLHCNTKFSSECFLIKF